jgi:hypothetical protein
MHNQGIQLIQQPPTGPTDREAYMDSKQKGFSTIDFNTPKLEHSYLA